MMTAMLHLTSRQEGNTKTTVVSPMEPHAEQKELPPKSSPLRRKHVALSSLHGAQLRSVEQTPGSEAVQPQLVTEWPRPVSS